MPTVQLTLHPFDSPEDAARVAGDIRAAGQVTVNTGDNEYNVTVGDVTVEGDVSSLPDHSSGN